MTTATPEAEALPSRHGSPLPSAPGRRVRVAVVDDHQLFVDSLGAVLRAQPDLSVVGTSTSLQEARSRLVDWAPDVLVLDRELPDGDAIDHVGEVRALVPAARVVMLTGHADVAVEQRARRAGVHAYVRKTAGLGEVLHAVRSELPQPALVPSTAVTLTARESEVLALVGAGLTNPAIAQRLGLSPFTIGNQVAVLRAKLGAHSKLDLVSRARREGLLF